VGGEERCGKKEQSHDILLYQGIGFLISILGKFNLINESTLHSLHNKKKENEIACGIPMISLCVYVN